MFMLFSPFSAYFNPPLGTHGRMHQGWEVNVSVIMHMALNVTFIGKGLDLKDLSHVDGQVAVRDDDLVVVVAQLAEVFDARIRRVRQVEVCPYGEGGDDNGS